MQIKRSVNFHIDFKKPWAQYSAAMMGIFIFFRAVWYFVSPARDGLPAAELWLHMILPLAVGIVYIALLRGAELNFPIVYGVVGAIFCGLMIALNQQYGSGFLIVFITIWYIISALVLLATVLGFLPNRLYLLLAFSVAVVLQYFASGVGGYIVHFELSRLTMLLREVSNVFGVASLAVFPIALAGKKIARS